ncbi:MAG TPA: ribonuclease P protein component [Verrucomicrobiae bacterium]|nr:ribonuclease P protein component [Verrucomicrobiae bacterium]
MRLPMPASSPDAGRRTPEARRLRLRRSARLQQPRDFMRVRQQGQRLALGCLIANWRSLPEGAKPRLGVVTSRKIGGAVVRSRARRLLRESFRQHQNEFTQPVELVLVARNSIAGRNFAGVEKDFLTTLRRAGLLKND